MPSCKNSHPMPCPSHLDCRLKIILIRERQRLDKAIKAGNEAKAWQQQKKVSHLKYIQSLQRSSMDKLHFDDDNANNRDLLRKQMECLTELTEEMGISEPHRVIQRRKEEEKPSGLESFRSIKKEIEAIDRVAVNKSMDHIVERMQGLLAL